MWNYVSIDVIYQIQRQAIVAIIVRSLASSGRHCRQGAKIPLIWGRHLLKEEEQRCVLFKYGAAARQRGSGVQAPTSRQTRGNFMQQRLGSAESRSGAKGLIRKEGDRHQLQETIALPQRVGQTRRVRRRCMRLSLLPSLSSLSLSAR